MQLCNVVFFQKAYMRDALVKKKKSLVLIYNIFIFTPNDVNIGMTAQVSDNDRKIMMLNSVEYLSPTIFCSLGKYDTCPASACISRAFNFIPFIYSFYLIF